MLEKDGAFTITLKKRTNATTETIEEYSCFDESDLNEMLQKMKNKIKTTYIQHKGKRIIQNESYIIDLCTF